MTDDAALDEIVRAVDPLRSGALPSPADTEVALRRLRAAGPPRVTASKRGRWKRPGVLAGTGAGIAAVITALALLLGATANTPAFAVTRNSNGTVTVRVSRLSDIPAAEVARANIKLAALGVRARIVPRSTSGGLVRCGPTRAVTIKPWRIPVHQLLILGADKAGRLGFATARPRLMRLAQRSARIMAPATLPAGNVKLPQISKGRVLRVKTFGVGQLNRTARVRIMTLLATCGP